MKRQQPCSFDTVIWDFNGTLLDDVKLTVNTINTMLRRHKLPTVTVEQHREGFRFPIIEYYRDLGFDIDEPQFERLSHDYHQIYMAEVSKCSLREGVTHVLDGFAAHGMRQFVLSALNQPMLDQSLGALGIGERFEAAYGLMDLLARSKTARGRELVERFAIDTSRTVFIGDTEHDMEVARALGCTPVAAAWGHQKESMFDAELSLVASAPRELFGVIEGVAA